MNKLILFDIDDTLIKSSSVHIEAFSKMFKEVYGVKTAIGVIEYQGMTDQPIIIETLKKSGLSEKEILDKMDDAIEAMVRIFLKEIKNSEIVLLEGAADLIKALKKNDILMGLVTGNIERIAKGKLEKARLWNYFNVGGFGSDDKERVNLVRLAVKKAEDKYAFKFNKNVFLFGDTPRDMSAATQAGVTAVGVATGIHTEEQLTSSGADIVLPGLNNTEKILKMILE